MTPVPPGPARWVVARVLPPDARDEILGDLAEVFRRDVARHGVRTARRRYRRKALSFAVHFGRERLRSVVRLRTRVGWPGVSWVDVKLGLRMLVRFPGLTIVGGVGLAVVIAGGIAVAIFDEVVHATLPFDEGDRIVVLENWDTEWNNQEHRILHDYVAWRDGLKTVDDIGAYRRLARTLVVADHVPELVRVAEMTASGFELTRVPPELGRYLVEADERADAPAVAVIGHDVWQRYFNGHTGALGATIQLGVVAHTVVGVMPADYLFPVNDRIWIPLRATPAHYARREGPVLYAFGRLAAGVDLATAQAELTAVGRRAAVAFPDTHARLEPRVTSYARSWFDDMEGYEIPLLRALVVLLLVIIGSNVAVLIYARTMTRQREIALRTALGAGRGRIVGQLLAESLLLSLLAAFGGLAIARVAIWQVDAFVARYVAQLGGALAPFWMDASLAYGAVVRDVIVLVAGGALVIGLVPAWRATGRRAQTALQYATAASRGRLARTQTALIVLQVAIAVAMLPAAGSLGWSAVRYQVADPAFVTDDHLTARLGLDLETQGGESSPTAEEAAALFAQRLDDLVNRLRDESLVSAATPLVHVPGNEPTARVEVAGGVSSAAGLPDRVAVGAAGPAFFETFGVPVLQGRAFERADGPVAHGLRDLDGDGAIDTATATAGRAVAIVNRRFVQEHLNGAAALGRLVRRARSSDPWREIVGVVEDFPSAPLSPNAPAAKVYFPEAGPTSGAPLVAFRTRGVAADRFAERLRLVAASVDPRLQVRGVRPMADVIRDGQVELRLAAAIAGLVTFSVLLQSAAGLFALMSFAVAQRRREIGIRVALGANPMRIVRGVLGRAFGQLAVGIAAGALVAALIDHMSNGELTGEAGLIMLPIVAALMLGVGLAAAVGPARRGLRIQPTEALRED